MKAIDIGREGMHLGVRALQQAMNAQEPADIAVFVAAAGQALREVVTVLDAQFRGFRVDVEAAAVEFAGEEERGG